MAKDRGGSIIAVSSIAAVRPVPGEVPYAAAKAGLNAMIIGLARAYGPSVRANVVMPGPFQTDVAKAWDMKQFDEFAEREIPLRRVGQPDEVVGAVVYLASDAASYTTGAVIKVDGGMAFRPG
jgi:NAD(P)-dependent dehydrogenase (short-subunit alcohol dehydrogenase family)